MKVKKNNMKTISTKPTLEKQIVRKWHLFDAKGKVLGRISSEISKHLIGKTKPYFVRNLDCGDYVVVVNAKDIKVTGKKLTRKTYYRHSGYPGGFRAETLSELIDRRPEEVIRRAVKGMLPQNKLKALMLKRLYVFEDENHKLEDKLKN